MLAPVTADDRRFAAGVDLAGEHATGLLVSELRAGGVEPIVLKGPVVARWLRERGGTRYSTDVDVLVPQSSRERAERVLAGLGYERLHADALGGEEHADTWVRDGAFSVDLHRRVVGAHADDDAIWAALEASSEEIELGGVACRVPAKDAQALLVALHAAQHGPRDPRIVHDLEQALELVPPEGWERALELARELDAVSAFSAGLARCERGVVVARSLGLGAADTPQAVLRATDETPTALGFERLARSVGMRAKARLLARELVPHPSYMRLWHPLASRGRLGLAAAYAYRPLWLARWAIPGLRAWLRARRAAS